MEKKTVYRPVVSLHGGHRAERPVHLERVDMVRIGSNFRGEPVWSDYPKNRTLCSVGYIISTVREANCKKCLQQREKAEDWNSPRKRVS